MVRWSSLRALAGRTALGAVLVLTLGHGVAPAAGAASPVGEWRFDESNGQLVLDRTANGLHGHLGGTDAPDAADPTRIAGVSGGALRFAGTSFVRLPESSQLALQALSVEAVVRAPASPGSWRYIVSRGSRGCVAGAYGLYTGEAGGVALYVFDGSQYVVSATARPQDVWDGDWHHIAGTFDGRSLRVYVDGRRVGDPMDAALRIDYASTSAGAYIGQYAGDCDLSYRGDVDLVRLSSGALSDDAIARAAADALGTPLGPVTPLPPAAPGTSIPAGSDPVHGEPPPDSGAPAGAPSAPVPTGAAPAAPQRACAVRLSRKRIASGRRSVVRARVLRAGPLRSLSVIARRPGRAATLATARTGATGRARLVLRVRRSGRVRVSVRGQPGCASALLKVSRSGARRSGG